MCLMMDGLGLNLERSGCPGARGLVRSPGSMCGLGSPRSGDAGKPDTDAHEKYFNEGRIQKYLNQETILETFELEGI